MRVNLFDPGVVRTAMRAQAFPGEDPETLPSPQQAAEQLMRRLLSDSIKNDELLLA